jgi:hypothetical protein
MTYWLTILALIVLGVLTAFSFGWMILLVAAAMIVLGPFRRRPAIYWPAMAAVVAFVLGYVAVAPLSCFATAEPFGVDSPVVCSSLLGIEYTGTTPYNPSQLPGLYAGVVLAPIAALVVSVAVKRRPFRDAAGSGSKD